MPGTRRLLVVASRNPHKVEEIRAILEGLPFQVASVTELGEFPEVVEDGKSFAENARDRKSVV